MNLYDFTEGKMGKLPVPPEIGVLNHRIFGRISQYLFLNSIVGKMAGFILCNRTASSILYSLRLSRLINEQVDRTYGEYGYTSMNAAFIHRYDNAIYPRNAPGTEEGDFITSPVSAYVSIRNIEAGVVEFFPGVSISVARMLGAENDHFLSGKLFVFTLKPHHDHTIDFPTESAILTGPSEISKAQLKVDSTDLNYIRNNARQSVMDENHRVVSILYSRPFDEEYALVEVGANIVNSIEQDYDESDTIHRRGTQKSHFNFGSTVILAIPDSFLAKIRIVGEIYDSASQFDGACEIKRGTVIMYDRSLKTGTYSISDGVHLRVATGGNGITETRNGHQLNRDGDVPSAKVDLMYSIGIEFSTQSAKVVLLDLSSFAVAFTGSLDYDTCFPDYQTTGGVLPSGTQDIRHTSPFMLLEALDRSFDVIVKGGLDLSKVEAVKVDGMQHCTVCTGSDLSRILRELDAEKSLLDQVGPCITRATSPIWEDRSPISEVQYLTEALKDQGGIDQLTGNRAELRFPAAQILKWAREFSDEYERTSNIFLLSAFISSIIAGKILPVDTGDGWGTNLNHLEIHQPGWSDPVLAAVDASLEEDGPQTPLIDRLGSMGHYDAMAGTISPYFVRKYGIAATAKVLIGTGDNPATLLGCGGSMVVSLGSSYTVNGVMRTIVPSTDEEYNVFGFTRGRAMALSVFTNGGKVQEDFLRRYLNPSPGKTLKKVDWEHYVNSVGSSRLAPDEKLMLPYLFDESVPLRKRGILRDGFSEADAEANIRALHLSQVLAMRLHSGHLGDVDHLCVVGGASGNPILRQWIADAFQAEVYSLDNADSAAPFGCALSGAVTALEISYEAAAERFIRRDDATVCHPVPENKGAMDQLIERYRKLEASALH